MSEKPLIVIDFNGALIDERPFKEAHEKWFSTMAHRLNDKSVYDKAFSKDYIAAVDEIMIRYLGEVDKSLRLYFARLDYAMEVISCMKKSDLYKEFSDYLLTFKNKYKLVLITTSPEPSVKPILEKLDLTDLFDMIISSPIETKPSKIELFKEFIKKYDKPDYYIGYGDEDLIELKDMVKKTISVNWMKNSKFKGNININSVKQLGKIL